MPANYQQAQTQLEPIEGGYCLGAECGTGASGETYRGIDRGQQPQWTGWKLVDQYKKQFGRPKFQKRFTGPLGAAIDTEVIKFYTAYWNNHGLNLFTNQALTNLVFPFIVHRQYAGVDVINKVGQQLGAKTVNKYKITPQVATAIEMNVANGYNLVRTAIIAHYNSLTKNTAKVRATFIQNRVNIFPTTISNNTAAAGAGILAALFGSLTLLR